MNNKPAPDFVADSQLVDHVHPSPNVNNRRDGHQPSLLILHYTGLPTVERSIAVLSDPKCEVSCHYVIDEAGHVTQMVPERLRAWHAGVSSWHGATDLNSMSIGIEIQNPGHNNGYPDFPAAQMSTVTTLAKDICARNAIRPERVLAHSDIAPLRKDDPGEKFNWCDLAKSGVGYWVKPEPIGEASALPSPSPKLITEAQKLLQDYGYACPQSGMMDDVTTKVVLAFQRHFRPARVDGLLDASTLRTLQKLVSGLST